jgi:acyl-CoA synthetase (AMP-forming)/AMP-acid ligase II
MRVVDPDGQTLGDNEVGEIVLSGPNLMKGYFRDPDATAATIVDGWLHTGDLGYRDRDGYYFLSGRIKELIIRGGINIYPKEIEEIIHQHPKISQVAVVGIVDKVWGERVHACVILKSCETLTYEELKDFLTDKIADFKVPSTLSLHDTFPQTGPGKIQKGRLVETVIQMDSFI